MFFLGASIMVRIMDYIRMKIVLLLFFKQMSQYGRVWKWIAFVMRHPVSYIHKYVCVCDINFDVKVAFIRHRARP